MSDKTISVHLSTHASERLCERTGVHLHRDCLVSMLNRAQVSGYWSLLHTGSIDRGRLVIPFLSSTIRTEPLDTVLDGYVAVTVLSGITKYEKSVERKVIWV